MHSGFVYNLLICLPSQQNTLHLYSLPNHSMRFRVRCNRQLSVLWIVAHSMFTDFNSSTASQLTKSSVNSVCCSNSELNACLSNATMYHLSTEATRHLDASDSDMASNVYKYITRHPLSPISRNPISRTWDLLPCKCLLCNMAPRKYKKALCLDDGLPLIHPMSVVFKSPAQVQLEQHFSVATVYTDTLGRSTLDSIINTQFPVAYGIQPNMELTDVTAAFILSSSYIQCPSENFDQVIECHIYLDGGHKDNANPESTWGLAAVLVNQLGQCWVAHTSSGILTYSEYSNIYCGEKPSSSFAPELYAQLMARIYLIQVLRHVVDRSLPVFIMYDNQSADLVASSCKYSGSNPILSRFTQTMNFITEQYFDNIKSKHVKSHFDHPFNDLADSICNHVMKDAEHAIVTSLPYCPISDTVIAALQVTITLNIPYISSSVMPNINSPHPTLLTGDFPMFASLGQEVVTLPPSVPDKYQPIGVEVVHYNVNTLEHERRKQYTVLSLKNKTFASLLLETRGKKIGTNSVDGFLMLRRP